MDDLESEIAHAVELPRYEYSPIDTYDGSSFALFRDRAQRAFGRGSGGIFYEMIDGQSYPLEFQPVEWASVPCERIVDFAFG